MLSLKSRGTDMSERLLRYRVSEDCGEHLYLGIRTVLLLVKFDTPVTAILLQVLSFPLPTLYVRPMRRYDHAG
jgi:hypothetical protein